MLTVSHLLGALQEDPDNTQIVSDLRDALASGDPARTGDQPLRLVSLAREQHEQRAEHAAAVGLLLAEVAELERESRDPDARAALLARAGRLEREELLDDEAATKSYEAALALRPGDESIKEALEQIGAAQANWKEIAKRFVDEAESASEPSLKCSLLVSAGSLVWKYKKRGREKDTDRVFKQALEADPSDVRAARLYAHTLTLREKWDELAAVLLEAAEKTKQKEDRLGFFLRAARVISRKLAQKDRAAAVYDQVVTLAPGHVEGMAYLVEHFTANERWDHLVQLYDDALRGRLKPEAEQGILLQIGMVHWRFRQSPTDAEPYFARLRKLDPVHPGMLGFYRDFLTSSGDHAKLLSILGDAQRITQDPKQKASLGVELARAAQASGAVDKAVDAWKAVQRVDPTNAEALPALRELYRGSQKWNALVEILKAEVDALGADDVDAKIAKLREMVGIYRDHLKLDVMAVNTWSAILALRPSDREALASLASTYEAMGRWNDLIQVLTKKAEASEDPTEQVALYMRVAKLWIDRFANYNQATRPLELVVEKDPGHREALTLLKEIYTKRRAWKQLFDVLSAEAALASDPDVRQAHRIELARLAADRLHRPADAIPLWKQVLEADASNKEAIDSLEKLSEREKDWPTLAEVIERRVGAADDDKERTRLLTKLATLYGEQVGDGAKAADAWKRVLRIDPKNGRALRTLRESYVQAGDWDALEQLYGETNDWDGLAEVLGNAADKAEDPAQKAALSFRAAEVYEAKIGEPQRAFRSYERVLAAIPTDERAARALLPIYEKDEKWSRLPALYDVLLGHTADAAAKLALLTSAREIAIERLKDLPLALRYATEAFQVDPTGDTTRATLESTGQRAGAYASVVQAYEQRLATTVGPDASVERRWLRGRVAALAAEQLGDVDRAAAALRAVLDETPGDADATNALDALLRKAGRHADLRAHFQRRIELAGDDAEKWMLISELARLEETELGDPVAAAALYRRAVEIDPKDKDSLAALDRLAEQGGRWDELVTVIERRRALADEEQRNELTLRLGELHLDRKPDLAVAKSALAEVLAARPSDARAITGLERVRDLDASSAAEIGRLLEPAYEATGAFEKLRSVLEARLAQTTEVDERRALRLRVAEISIGPLGDAPSAYRTLETAFLDAPSDAEIGTRFAAAAEASGQHEPYALALATVVEAGELAPADLLVIAERAAQVYRDVLGRPADAEPFERKVLAIEPAHEASFTALKELYTDAERWQDLQALYRQRIAQTVDAQSKLDLLLQLCFVFEELIDEPRNAIRVYRDVLEIEPRHAAARRALDRLYARTEQWRDLAELLRLDIEDGGDAEATETLVRIGGLHETKLGEPQQAVDAYEAALGRTPDHAASREALERLLAEPTQRQRVASILEPVYEMRDDHAGLSRALEVQLEDTTDADARVRLLGRIADLASVQLGDWHAAFHAYARAVPLAPADAALRENLANAARARAANAADDAARLRAHEERAIVLEAALAKITREAPGSATEREIVGELAALWDDEAQDPARAEPWLERSFELLSDDPDARLRTARALERIHVAAGASEKLAIDLRRQIDLETDPATRGQLLVRLADLQEEKLGDRAAAVRTHRERVDNDPSDVDALRSLERLYAQSQSWPELLGVLEQLDAASRDDAERRGYALRAAALAHEKLGDRARAVAAYADVLSRFGPARDALEPLIALHEAEARWQELLEGLDQLRELETDGAARAANLFRVGEIRRTRLHELEAAVETYGAVLELEPSHPGAIAALVTTTGAEDVAVRFAAARLLRPRFEAQGPSRDLLHVLDVLAKTDDPTDRLEALRRGAEVADALGDAGGAYARLAAAVRGAGTDPDLGYLLGEAERLAGASDKWLDHGALLEDLAPEVGDADLQIETYRRLAVLRRDRLEDTAGARATYERILELRPDDADAIGQLEALVSAGEDWPALLDVVRRKTDFAQGAERAALLVRQAEICETRLNDVSRAIAALDEVLVESDPPNVYASLERLYTASERWPDLVALYERMLDKRIGAAVEVRHRLGTVQWKKLGEVDAAIEQFREALSQGAAHEPTVQALETLLESGDHKAAAATVLEPIYLARLQWKKVQRTLEARLEAEQDLDARKELLARLGQLHEDYLEDLDGAFGMYVRLFREDPRDESSWDTLTRLSRVLERYDRLADTYRDTLKETGVDDAVTYKLALLAADLYETRTTKAVEAIELYKLASAYAPSERAPFEALERLLVRGQSWADLLRVYRDRVDVAETDDERLALLEKSAEVERDRNMDADRAIAIYREMLELDPRHPTATDALESLLVARERWNDLADLLRLRIDHADGSDAEIALKARLGEVQARHLGDLDAAIDTYEDVLRTRPDHQPSVTALEAMIVQPAHQLRIIRILEPIYSITDQWKKQIAIHEAEAKLTEEPSEQVRLFSEIARLHEDRGRNPSLAFAAYSRALGIDPGNEEVRGHVDRLAALLDDWNGLVSAYEAAITRSSDPVVQASLLSTLARVHDEKRGDPRAAIQTFERILAVDPADPSPLDALEALHTMVGDWVGMVATLEKKVERSYDPVERGETLRRAGSVAEDLLGDPRMATALYKRAIQEDDTDAIAYESLDRLYEEASDHASLGPVLSRRLELETDADVRADIALRLGALAEEHLREPETAIRAYQQALADRPGEPTAVVALGRLYERQAQWPDFLENLRLQAASAADTASRVAFTFRAAEVLERELDDVPEALSTHQNVLSIDPRHEPSISALVRISRLEEHREQASQIVMPYLEAQGRWQDVAELEELVVAASSDPFERQQHLRRLAQIHEDGRGDKVAAFEATRRALAEDASDRALVEQLERLGGELRVWEQVADTLSARAGGAVDPDTGLDLLARLARIAEGPLADDPRAIDAHRRRLQIVSDDETSLAALDRLYTKSSSWNELADVVERRAQSAAAAGGPDHAELLVRLGALRWERFGDTAGAFAAFREVLERDPSEPRALGATEGLLADERLVADVVEVLEVAYRATGATTKTAGLYDVRIRLADSDGERVRLWLELAQLRENELADLGGGLDATVRAYELDPRDEGLLAEIERLAGAAGRFEVLRGLAERVVEGTGKDALDSTMKRDLFVRAAGWYRDRLSDPEAAEKVLRASIAADREHGPAHEQLVELLREPGRERSLVDGLLAWAEVELDEPARVARFFEAGRLAESALRDTGIARRAYERVLEGDPANGEALDELIRLAIAGQRWADAAVLLERRIDAQSDPDARVAQRRQLAGIVRDRLEDPKRSIDAWQAVLDEVPTDLEAISALETLFESERRYRDLEDLVQRRLDIAESDAERIAGRVRLARLADLQGRRSDAMEQLREILADAPEDREALDALEALYQADGKIDLLAESVGSRAEAASARGDQPESLRLLARLAQIQERDLKKPAEAAATLERVRESRPDDGATLSALARLYRGLGRHRDAVTALEALGRTLDGDAARANALEVAEIAEGSLSDDTVAEAALRRALAFAPGDATARTRLRALFDKTKNHRGRAELLAEDAEGETDKAKKLALYKEIADLYAKQLGDAASAASFFEKAVALDPEDRNALLPLCDLYIAAGRSGDAVPVLEKIIASFGTRRSKDVATYHHRLGQALEGMGKTTEALGAYDAAMRIDLTSVPVLRDFGRLCYSSGDLDRAQKAFRSLLLQRLDASSGITKGDLYFYLGDITAKQGDPKKAISMLDRALVEQAGHPQATALLAQLKAG